MNVYKRLLALLLAAAMLFGTVGCAKEAENAASEAAAFGETADGITLGETVPGGYYEETPTAIIGNNGEIVSLDTGTADPVTEVTTAPADSTDRESLVGIAQMVTGSTSGDLTDMTDEEITQLITDTLEQGSQSGADAQDPGPELNPDEPYVDTEDQKENYDENGALEKPFDQIYPELVENGTVEYDEETILVKLSNDQEGAISDGMKAAGIAALDSLFAAEKDTWYEAKLEKGTDIPGAVETLRALPEVLLVDYNYTTELAVTGDYVATPDHYKGNDKLDHRGHMNHHGIYNGLDVMEDETRGGSESIVVAVIDTGVDYTHEDLKQNIWVNTDEIPDNGADDDGNGYIDDYYGVNLTRDYQWDSNEPNGMDDHGHGTHVAGIIAAQNNNLGTMGIAYNVKIMPIKAAKTDGTMDQATIARAVQYAVENGAEVINMSFGSVACSDVVQQVLKQAYESAVLVASAGNTGAPNEGQYAIPNYPAALSYVIGVMSVDNNGKESAFTNFDRTPNNGVEYEVYAPGESIVSTIPGNRYASWSGTSMAAPVVSAMAALLRSHYDRETYNTKFIYGQLTSTSDDAVTCLDPDSHGSHSMPNVVNLYQALTDLPEPNVNVADYYAFDTVGFSQDTEGKNNGDGVIDAGETIALGMFLRNSWGTSSNTVVSVAHKPLAGQEDGYVTIHNSTVDFGSVGTYATVDNGGIYTAEADEYGKVLGEILTGWEDPFYITVSKDCPNNYVLRLEVTVTSYNGLNPQDTEPHVNTTILELAVRKGTVLPRTISEDMTLTNDQLYIIEDATVIEQGVTVNVDPGTHIQFWTNDPEDPYADSFMASLTVNGEFYVNGTKDNPVYIYPSELMENYVVTIDAGSGLAALMYADVTNLSSADYQKYNSIDYAYGCTFRQNRSWLYYRYLSEGKIHENNTDPRLNQMGDMENCVFYKLDLPYWSSDGLVGTAKCCAFVDCSINLSSLRTSDCLFLGNGTYQEYGMGESTTGYFSEASSLKLDNVTTTVNASQMQIYYRPETGTTYIADNTAYDMGIGDILEEYVAMIDREGDGEADGGQLAIIETADELNWLMNNLNSQYWTQSWYGVSLGIEYNFFDQTYQWSNGEPIGEFLQVPGVTDTYSGATLKLMSTGLTSGTGSYYLYEIPGLVYVTDIRFQDYAILMDLESSYQMKVTCDPVNVPYEDLIFESTDENVFTVSDTGLITPTGFGTAEVKVYSFDRKVMNYATVYVRDYEALDGLELTLAEEDYEIAIGETIDSTVLYTPEHTTRKTVTYSSSDESIATVDVYGNITGVGSGTATITATSTEANADGAYISASTDVLVYKQATSLELDKEIWLVSLEYEDAFIGQEPVAIPSDGAETDLVWTSTDETVLSILSPGIETEFGTIYMDPQAAGITTIQVTDRRSGLTASCLCYVVEGEVPAVKQIYRSNYLYTFVLLENGDLLFWSDETKMPAIITTGVEKFADHFYNILTYNTDGTVTRTHFDGSYGTIYWSNDITSEVNAVLGSDWELADIALGLDGYTMYVVTTEGKAYAWSYYDGHYNDYGQLGIGSTQSVTSPSLVNVDNASGVKEVLTYNHTTFFLTNDGSLFVAGSDHSYLSPYRIDTGVTAMFENGSTLAYIKDGTVWVCDASSLNITSCDDDISGYDKVYLRGSGTRLYYSIGIAEGIPYKFGNGYGATVIPGITNAKDVYVSGRSYYIITEDGLLYGYGNNDGDAFGGSTSESEVTEPVCIPTIPTDGQSIRVTGNNLDSGRLIPKALELTFSQEIKTYGAQLYADGKQITYSSQQTGINTLEFYRSSGFQEGVQYKLVFPAGSLISPQVVTNTEEITINFTYRDVKQDVSSMRLAHKDGAQEIDFLNISRYELLDLDWYVTDNDILSVEGNTVTPKAQGTTTLKFTEHVTGLTGEIFVTVTGENEITEYLEVDSINLYDQTINEGTEEEATIQILDDKFLKVNFDQKLTQVGYELLMEMLPLEGEEPEDDLVDSFLYTKEPVDNSISFDLDEITIKPTYTDAEGNLVEDFQEGREYALYLIAEDTTGNNGTALKEDLLYTFTYYAAPEDIDFSVVNTAVIDETIDRFYWTSSNFAEAINGIQAQLQYHPNFYRNAVINRLATDTKMDSWLRVQSYGGSNQIPLGSNYWGTTDQEVVGLQVIDGHDYPGVYNTLNYENFLTTAPENTFPFVTDVTILNKYGEEVSTVSNEEITVRITFNRDMDTTVPLEVTYGASYPYADCVITGSYVDARTWEGKELLTTVLDNGYQYFTIGNGRSAEDGLELYTDWMRFFFVLDTTAAQALTLRGEATNQGIQLTWTQDDFDTLMGYNVYRAETDEEGYYTKVNDTIIPADTKEFLDDGVESGKVYYYNFTVVQTDLTESAPSGKISIMSKDLKAPLITHTSIGSAFTGSNLVISATIQDDVTVTGATLYYRTTGETTYRTAVMNKMNDKYTAIIPADHITTEGLQYYITATDGVNTQYFRSAAVPQKVTVTEAISANALGDVNGDGKISALDALLLLQGLNDLYNLTAEEFARADLNGDKVLSSAEALRILDYVSGKIGSLAM